jgi:hypothetical protein
MSLCSCCYNKYNIFDVELSVFRLNLLMLDIFKLDVFMLGAVKLSALILSVPYFMLL